MANHSKIWYDGATTRKRSSHSSYGIAAITNRLYTLGRDMPRLKESIHAIQEMEEVKEVKKESVPCDLPILNPCGEPYVSPIPFLGCLKEHKDEAQAFRIIKGLKEVKINRHLINAIKRMLEYVNYVREMFYIKKEIKEGDAGKLNARHSTILQNQLHPKEKDL
ncbi:hypothetical protein Tco_1027141 [Tanacetum coccineum]